MYTKTATVVNALGLHARPAAEFVKTAGKYKARIQICRGDRPDQAVNAKSMVMVLSLSAARGTEVRISATGEDEREAVEALTALLEAGCMEECGETL